MVVDRLRLRGVGHSSGPDLRVLLWRVRAAERAMNGALILLRFAALLLNLAHIACVARRP